MKSLIYIHLKKKSSSLKNVFFFKQHFLCHNVINNRNVGQQTWKILCFKLQIWEVCYNKKRERKRFAYYKWNELNVLVLLWSLGFRKERKKSSNKKQDLYYAHIMVFTENTNLFFIHRSPFTDYYVMVQIFQVYFQ